MYIGTAGKKGKSAMTLRMKRTLVAILATFSLLFTGGFASVASADTSGAHTNITYSHKAPIIRGDDTDPSSITSYFALDWIKSQSGSGYVPDERHIEIKKFSTNANYSAVIDVNLKNTCPVGVADCGSYDSGTVQLRIPTKSLVARDGTITGGVLTGPIPTKGSPDVTDQTMYVKYYDGDTLVIENHTPVSKAGAHMRIPIDYRIAQYTNASGNVVNKAFSDYTDGSKAEYTVTLITPEGEETSNSISRELNTEIDVTLQAYDKTVSRVKKETLEPKADYKWSVSSAYAQNNSGRTQDALFDKLTFEFTPETLAEYPYIYFDTMPVSTGSYDVEFSSNKQKVTITCKNPDTCTAIRGNSAFRVVLPASDYDLTPDSGTVTAKYTVKTTATPVDGYDQARELSTTKTLSFSWYTPADPTPTPTPSPTRTEETDNGYTALVQQNGTKPSGTKEPNPETGEAPRAFDLNALLGGQNQYQSYTVNSNFDSPRATTRLAGSIPTMTIASSKSGALSAGDEVTYTATLTNNKTYDSRSVAFEIPFPEGMSVDTRQLSYTVNGSAYTMPAANVAWDDTNRILTIKAVPNISPGSTFTATIPATATQAVNAGFGILQLDQITSDNQVCGETECVMTVRNTGTASTPEGVPFEISIISPANHKIKDNTFTSITIGDTPVDIRTEFVSGSNGVAYLPSLAPGQEITFRFYPDFDRDQPAMIRGKFGGLTLLPLDEDKISPAGSTPYVMVGALRKDVQANYQKRPFVFETIDNGLSFLNNSGVACTDTYGTETYYNCRLNYQDAQIRAIQIGKSSNPTYVDTTTHPESIVKIYGTPDGLNPTWTLYATLHYTYHTTKPAEADTGSGKGYYLTSVDYEPGAEVGSTGKKYDIKLPDGVFAVRVVEEGYLRNLQWDVKTVIFADGPRVSARLEDLFTKNPYPGNQNVTNTMFQFTYDPADAPADGSIPSADKLMERQSLSENTLPPYMRANPTVPENGPIGYNEKTGNYASRNVSLVAEPQRTSYLSHTFVSDTFSATEKTDGSGTFVLSNSLWMHSDVANGYGARCTYSAKTENGEWKKATGARYYSLQPPGVRVLRDTVRIDDSAEFETMEILDVQIEENWRGSGRQMLIVTVKNVQNDITPADCSAGVDVGTQKSDNVEQSRIHWDADYTNVSYFTYGDILQRLDAVEVLIDDDALYKYYEPKANAATDKERGVTLEGNNVAPNGWTAPNKALMNKLDGDDTAKKYLYGYKNMDLPDNPTTLSQFTKYVAAAGSSYALKTWVNPNNEYTYQLAYANQSRTSQSNIVIYDSLENNSGDNANRFHGTMTGLRYPKISELGIAPKVYYSTTPNLDVSGATPADIDLTDSDIWHLIPESQLANFDWSQVKAFAVDCSETTNGEEFLLPRDAGFTLEFYMKAPDDAETKALLSEQNPSASAYNRAYTHMLVPDATLDSGAPAPGANWEASVQPSTSSEVALHRSVIHPRALKVLSNHALAQDQFSFEIRKAGSSDVISTGTNMAGNLVNGSAEGLVGFSAIEATSSDIGEVTYEFTEVNDAKPGYTYDSTTKTVTVQVVDAGDGQVTVLGDDNWPTFNNEYHARGAILVQGKKEVTGTNPPALRNGQFTFTLYDSNGDPLATTTNTANGDIVFENISVTEANIGTNNFTVEETGDCPFEWVCDTSTKNVSVTVTDNDDGTLTATVNGDTPAFTFTNEYIPVAPTGFFSGTLGGYVFLIVCAFLGGAGAFWLQRKRRALLD